MSELNRAVNQTFGDRLRVRVCGILIEKERLLMIKHLGVGNSDVFWAPPGGGMEYGEDANTTLIREFKEETGLDIAVKSFLFVNEYLNKPLHGVELFFEVIKTGGILVKGGDPEMPAEQQIIDEVSWLSLDDLHQMPNKYYHNGIWDIQHFNELKQNRGYIKRTHY